MKFVYVLVSSENDLYYEQALMSVWSLIQHNPSAKPLVLCDDRTFSSLKGKRAELKNLAEIQSVSFDEKIRNVERSRLIKTAIPSYVSGDFLYIDCDTIICGDLSSAEKFDFSLAGVLDGHVLLDEHVHKKYFLERDRKLGFQGTKKSGCNINGGVIFFKECEESVRFFEKWNEMWKFSAYRKKDFHDQPALNEANFRTGLKMQLLPGEWNCQLSHGGLEFLKDAKIIHYYSSEFSGKNYVPYYRLADKNLQVRIKNAGEIPDDIKKMILDAKFQFNKVHLVNDRRLISIMQSPLVFTLAEIKQKIPFLFCIMENSVSFLRKTVKKAKKILKFS
jgi:lipopolysaccharide biosynthesis glycosyltransferase